MERIDLEQLQEVWQSVLKATPALTLSWKTDFVALCRERGSTPDETLTVLLCELTNVAKRQEDLSSAVVPFDLLADMYFREHFAPILDHISGQIAMLREYVVNTGRKRVAPLDRMDKDLANWRTLAA
jgi:hypothetical protein